MATAPVPGSARRDAAKRPAIVITVEGEAATLWPGDLGPDDDEAMIREVGLTYDNLFDGEGALRGRFALRPLWWLARRQGGERVRYAQVKRDFPATNDEIEAMLADGRITVERVVEDEVDPGPLGSDAG